MKKLCTTMVLVTITFLSFSQSNFKEGTIIFQNGDSIERQIDSKSLKKMGQLCRFKKNMSDEVVQYGPEQLSQFYFESGKHYISKSVLIDKQQKQVFLEYLVNGICNLYYIKVKNNEHFFLEKDQEIIELKNTEENREINDVKYLRDRKEYIGTLKYYFQDAEKLNSEIPRLGYNYKSLVGITKDYHYEVCDDYECLVYESDIKTKVYLGPYFGYQSSQITNQELTAGYYDGFIFGINLLMSNIFGISERMVVSISPNITQMTYPGEYYNDYIYLAIPFKASYHFMSRSHSPFIDLGVNNYFPVSKVEQSSVRYQYSIQNGSIIAAPTYNNRFKRQYRFAPFFGLGYKMQYKKVDYRIALNYEFLGVDMGFIESTESFNAITVNLSINFQLTKDQKKKTE